MKKITAIELEQQISEIEEIRVVIRCKKNKLFNNYPYINKADKNISLNAWCNKRLQPLIGKEEVEIIDGYGNIPNKRCKIATIRNSYKRDQIDIMPSPTKKAL